MYTWRNERLKTTCQHMFRRYQTRDSDQKTDASMAPIYRSGINPLVGTAANRGPSLAANGAQLRTCTMFWEMHVTVRRKMSCCWQVLLTLFLPHAIRLPSSLTLYSGLFRYPWQRASAYFSCVWYGSVFTYLCITLSSLSSVLTCSASPSQSPLPVDEHGVDFHMLEVPMTQHVTSWHCYHRSFLISPFLTHILRCVGRSAASHHVFAAPLAAVCHTWVYSITTKPAEAHRHD